MPLPRQLEDPDTSRIMGGERAIVRLKVPKKMIEEEEEVSLENGEVQKVKIEKIVDVEQEDKVLLI